MNFNHNQVLIRHPSFFSNNLTPQNYHQIPSVHTNLKYQPIYFMATQNIPKITTTSRRPLKQEIIKNFSQTCQNSKQPDKNFTNVLLKAVYIPKMRKRFKRANFQDLSMIDVNRLIENNFTIRHIRSQRSDIEKQSKKLQNSFNYFCKKLQKQKKKQQYYQNKKQEIKIIHDKNKKNKLLLQCERQLLLKENFIQKSRLKSNVIKQKYNKNQSKIIFNNYLQKNASQLREQSQKIQQEIIQNQIGQIQAKKANYHSQRQKQKQMLLNKQKKFQNKLLMAQIQFKNKWIKQFSENARARKEYLIKKQVINKKMQTLYSEIKNQDKTPDFDSSKKQRSIIMLKNKINPEQILDN